MDRIARLARASCAPALLFLLGACAGTPHADNAGANAGLRPVEPGRIDARDSARRASEDVRDTIARIATDMVGVRYRYGGASPEEGFDCSGLVSYSYSHAGLRVPRNSVELFNAAAEIPLERAAKGDLVFFQDQQKLSHVGIYLGDNRFVHAPSSGSNVRVSTLDTEYYRRHLVGVGRLIDD